MMVKVLKSFTVSFCEVVQRCVCSNSSSTEQEPSVVRGISSYFPLPPLLCQERRLV